MNRLRHAIHARISRSKGFSLRKLPKNQTVLIHVGKTGGRSLKDGLDNAQVNRAVIVCHIKPPPYRADLKYIIVARGPLSRLISAYNWRSKLVVIDANQRDRFPGEYEALTTYAGLNEHAEMLYDRDGRENKKAQDAMFRIHHIRENISFYLRDLLDKVHPGQILDVLMQENLDADIRRVFGYENVLQLHKNSPRSGSGVELSELAKNNLRRFLSDDYQALMRLYCWGKLKPRVMEYVFQQESSL